MMPYVIALLTLSLLTKPNMQEIYTFSTQRNIKEWRIVNDGVMGGISNSSLLLTDGGNGKFSGHVSLANNGGFASIQLNTTIQLAEEKKFIVLRVKGDGKQYEFRLKGKVSQSESYVHPFVTSGEWETLKLPISQFYPQFRGRKLNIPNFNFKSIEQLSFLIANKQEEDFKLLIDWIGVE
jgi:NADH dehydrogenase [ubiquinone] 1 alpha subcomplex assembly factor 1